VLRGEGVPCAVHQEHEGVPCAVHQEHAPVLQQVLLYLVAGTTRQDTPR
jgi:hypothetical protein